MRGAAVRCCLLGAWLLVACGGGDPSAVAGGAREAGASFGGRPDGAASPDDAAPDGAPADGAASACTPPVAPRPDGGVGWRLSQTGLYCDILTKALSPRVMAYEPSFPLWSDGADKARFIELPAGSTIDTSDPDHWVFPVGTRIWKEFSRGGRRLETRLLERTGTGPMDYFLGAFLWNDDETDALFVPDGAENVHGTDHDVPAQKRCWTCHQGEAGRVLGVSAVQLGRADRPPNLKTLAAQGKLSVALGATTWSPPGPPEVASALGYLHANCGHCHNPDGVARPDTDINLRLALAEATPADTAIYRTAIGVPLQKFRRPGLDTRVVPGNPDGSGLFTRMRTRDPDVQMPPIATKHVDDRAVEIVRAWIATLPPR